MTGVIFWSLAVVLLAGALGTVLARSLYRAAYCLAATLLTTAFFYFLLTSPVLAAVQILLYTGGVLTLVVFAMVMTEGSQADSPRYRKPLLAAVLAAATFACLARFVLGMEPATALGGLESGKDVGVSVFTTYLVPFELLSVLLLGAIFGALMIARKDELS